MESWRESVRPHFQVFRKRITDAFVGFLDHLLRELPSKTLINLRRSYFARHAVSEERTLLGGGIEAMKGVYQSIRLAEVLPVVFIFAPL